ncbi:MAG: hypothetical protein H0U92_02400, partial [Actinobacteria bacterium]|nr:hypothetical protein [Actinomycetota bacterium]
TALGKNAIDRITLDGKITEFLLPDQTKSPESITRGPDHAMWFTESYTNTIGRITTAGVITEFPVGRWGASRIIAGPDGALWFTGHGDTTGSGEWGIGYIGRITTSGAVTIFPVGKDPREIIVGPDGKLWVVDQILGIFRVSTSGVVEDLAVDTGIINPLFTGLTRGPDDAMWFSVASSQHSEFLGRIDTSGTTTYKSLYPEANTGGNISELTTGPDGNIWLAWWNLSEIQRMTPDDERTSYKIDRPIGITRGPDGNIWFTTQGGPVGKLNVALANAG